MPKALKILGLTALVGLVLAIAGIAWMYSASQAVPDFYEEALVSVPAVEQEQASDEMVEQATALVNEVRRTGDWEALFTDEQINGWLAVDLVKNHPGLLPKEASDPRVVITPDGAKLACRWDNGQFETVFSLDGDIYLAEPNVVALRIRGARAGALPLPLDSILEAIRKAAADADLPLSETQTDGDPVVMITIPPPAGAERASISVENLELREGAIYLAGRTETEDGSSNLGPAGLLRHYQALVMLTALRLKNHR